MCARSPSNRRSWISASESRPECRRQSRRSLFLRSGFRKGGQAMLFPVARDSTPIPQLPDGFVANAKQKMRTRRESTSGRRLRERRVCVARRLPGQRNVAGVLPDRAFQAGLPVRPPTSTSAMRQNDVEPERLSVARRAMAVIGEHREFLHRPAAEKHVTGEQKPERRA